MDEKTDERMVDVGEVRLHVVSEGGRAESGGGEGKRAVILLHGFPEFWFSWRAQLEGLAKEGYWVLAPDLRGYNLSDKPKGVGSYGLERLAGDVIGLMDAIGVEKAIVVGHDWGGAVAWYTAMRYPERVEKLAVLNCPHPRLFVRALSTWAQLKKSWYIFFFQLPWLPERMVTHKDFGRRALRGTAARRGAFSDEDLERFREAFARPGAATAALNYYRAMLRRAETKALSREPLKMPVQVIWGDRDRFLGVELLRGLEEVVANLRVHHVPDAGHWVQQDAPEEVNRVLLEFLAS